MTQLWLNEEEKKYLIDRLNEEGSDLSKLNGEKGIATSMEILESILNKLEGINN